MILSMAGLGLNTVVEIAHPDPAIGSLSVPVCNAFEANPLFGAWTHRDDPSLWIPGSETAYNSQVEPPAAHNFHAIGSVAAPPGVQVDICEPDFSQYPETRECNDDTVISTACGANCNVSATSPRYQMLRLSFVSGYGCWDPSATAPYERLLGDENPRRKETCPFPAHASAWLDDGVCGVSCDAGYNMEPDTKQCIDGCASRFTPTCPDDSGVLETCTLMPADRYTCEVCALSPGHYIQAFADRTTDKTCDAARLPCAAGTHSPSGAACVPCPIHTYSEGGADACTPCAIGEEAVEGSTICDQCDLSPGSCSAGSYPAHNRSHALQHLQTTPLTIQQKESAMRAWCDDHAACLPCAPGHFSDGTVCVECPLGQYQPHWGRAACFPCAVGQSTPAEGSQAVEDCRCTPGFE